MDEAALDAQTRLMPCTGCILVVDDDPDIRAVLREYIEALGCSVAIAVDGLDALASLERYPRPCLVLLDINMPRMDGQDFARAVRRDVDLCELPIVSMSAGTQRLGPPEVYCHLHKPFGLERLDADVARFCRETEPLRLAST